MRNIIEKLLIGVMALGLGQYALSAEPEGKASIGGMTVAQPNSPKAVTNMKAVSG